MTFRIIGCICVDIWKIVVYALLCILCILSYSVTVFVRVESLTYVVLYRSISLYLYDVYTNRGVDNCLPQFNRYLVMVQIC